MRKENQEIIENVIAEFKKNEAGKVFTENYSKLFNDRSLKHSLTEIMVNELELIKNVNDHYFLLTKKGWDFTSFKEIESENEFRKEKEKIEYEKSKIDLELAKKMLKEYPKTKWIARIGFGIAVVLAVLELIKNINS